MLLLLLQLGSRLLSAVLHLVLRLGFFCFDYLSRRRLIVVFLHLKHLVKLVAYFLFTWLRSAILFDHDAALVELGDGDGRVGVVVFLVGFIVVFRLLRRVVLLRVGGIERGLLLEGLVKESAVVQLGLLELEIAKAFFHGAKFSNEWLPLLQAAELGAFARVWRYFTRVAFCSFDLVLLSGDLGSDLAIGRVLVYA